MKKAKVGVLGCGNISEIYLKNCTQLFKNIDVVACADINLEKAKSRAKEFNIVKACTVEEMLLDPQIEIVINLTIPKVHAEVCISVLEAGKHVYVEKPLAVTRDEGKKILKMAKSKNLLIGTAPDTFMGGGQQTCRKLIDDGWIGKPIAANAFIMCHGHESWHPDPEFYYKVGGGPLFDMGPYYLTALINLIGPIRRVTASAAITFAERTITSSPKFGQKIRVETPTHISGILDFENGAICNLTTSFDVWHSNLPFIEIYGTEGTLSVPDPNTFGDKILVKRWDAKEWSEIPLIYGFTDNCRGIGLADMVDSLYKGKKHRANGEMAYHVLDIMQGMLDSSKDGKRYQLDSTCERPEAMTINQVVGFNEY